MLACLNTSAQLIHTRALAVPDAEHPVEAVGARPVKTSCCVPHKAVAASSSFTGWNTMFCAARYFFAFCGAWS